jgi:hypothetical protein
VTIDFIFILIEQAISQEIFEEKVMQMTRLVELHCTNVSTGRNLILFRVRDITLDEQKVTELMLVGGIGDGSDMIRYPTYYDLAPASIC